VVLLLGWPVACADRPPPLALVELATDDAAFPTTLKAFSGSPIVGENRVTVLLNGEETFPALLRDIRAARRTITFEAYIFHEGRVADELIQAFVDRCRAGVRATLLLDAHGAAGFPASYVDGLRAAGCEIVPDFRPLRPWNLERTNKRNHRRIVVVDGRVGYTGGYGIDDAWNGDGRTPGHWRETNVRLEGPVVHQLQEAFLEHWHEATGRLLGGEDYFPWPPVEVKDAPARAHVVKSSPVHGNHAMYLVFLQAIKAARVSVLISTPYLLPDDQLTDVLLDAAQRGVSVRVLVPSVERGSGVEGVEYVTQASQRDGFDALLRGGIHLNEYAPALLHTKMMIIDGAWATIGSTNFDNRSMALNDELNVVLYDRAVAARLEQIFNEDLRHSHPVTLENLRRRGWLGRVIGLLTSPFRGHF
jgi:cardiolipin synthase